jgi:hypothetical protein
MHDESISVKKNKFQEDAYEFIATEKIALQKMHPFFNDVLHASQGTEHTIRKNVDCNHLG